jgi:hypothetical protein
MPKSGDVKLVCIGGIQCICCAAEQDTTTLSMRENIKGQFDLSLTLRCNQLSKHFGLAALVRESCKSAGAILCVFGIQGSKATKQ